MSALTKAHLANRIVEEIGLNNREAKEFVDTFFEKIKETLINGDDVKISGFGNLILRDKNARPGRNPKTGEEKMISARRVVSFKPSQKLKETVEKAK
ncbi:MAG: integration host factor subunit alpha [Gammaproteobacteria bacterium]|nr:integration host factor subunit alpha [Gammaproteobacteria bacterium]